MKIGIDISQTAYGGGVANFIENLVDNLIRIDGKNEYILFGSSLRNIGKFVEFKNKYSQNRKVKVIIKRLPPTALDLIWNKTHSIPIENLIGEVDVFITSDWVQPPTKAKKVAILYDLIVYKYPQEAHSKTDFSFKNLIISPNIVETQKRAHRWMKKEADLILCISESTKKDAIEILGIDERKIKVIYPGYLL